MGLEALMNWGPEKMLIRCSKESQHPAVDPKTSGWASERKKDPALHETSLVVTLCALSRPSSPDIEKFKPHRRTILIPLLTAPTSHKRPSRKLIYIVIYKFRVVVCLIRGRNVTMWLLRLYVTTCDFYKFMWLHVTHVTLKAICNFMWLLRLHVTSCL